MAGVGRSRRNLVRREPIMPEWNKCDVCGRFIAYEDVLSGKAIRRMDTPDSHVSSESWTNLCPTHNTLPLTQSMRDQPSGFMGIQSLTNSRHSGNNKTAKLDRE